MNNQIKIIDFHSKDAAVEFTKSLHETGFAIIQNHPLEYELIDTVYDEWKFFFNNDTKFNYKFNTRTQDGYFPFESENAKGYKEKDLKEFFQYYEWGIYPQNMSKKTVLLYHQLMAIGRELLIWIDTNSPEHIKQYFSMPLYNMILKSTMNLLRIIHYPPIDRNDGGAIRAAEHADINLITILASGSQPGLQVLNNGHWIDIECNPGWLVINIGDMLKECSNGYYPSTIHRVVNPIDNSKNISRFSIPLFIHPKNDVELSKRYSAKSFLEERLLEIGLKN
jgi:isopenicillin N synthase-like dioxygenase